MNETKETEKYYFSRELEYFLERNFHKTVIFYNSERLSCPEEGDASHHY